MFERNIDCAQAMITAIRQTGIMPLFRCGVPGWSVEERTAPGFWFMEDEELGPWDWKVDAVREPDIMYGKFLGGKAAFATRSWYRELMNWRRSLPRYRTALGEKSPGKTQGERLMKVLAPIVLQALRENGALETGELRSLCAGRLTQTQVRSLGAKYKAMLQPSIKKNIMDSVLQFLQMGTWCITGDIARVYRGADLRYNGWQRSSYTTPEALSDLAPTGGPAPFWAKHLESADTVEAEVQRSPETSRDRIVEHLCAILPDATPETLGKLI